MSKKRSARRHVPTAPKSWRAAQSATAKGPLTISACLIVKDEERNLPRCLRSLKPLVDEIVVVDTGSSDRTVEIAQEAGAKVHHFVWCDDFSAARNESIKHATGDWIIWVDADEELIENIPGVLHALCAADPPSGGYLVTCRSLSNELGDYGSVIKQWRLFKNHTGLQFKSRIHEHLSPPDGSRQVELTNQDEVWIKHWGYLPVGDIMKRKRDRNFPLLELAAKENPDDPFNHYNLGKQHCAEYTFESGLEHLQRAIALWNEQGRKPFAFAGNMFALAINAAVELKRNELALEIEAETPPDLRASDILFQAGVANMRLGRREEALERLNKAWREPKLAIETDPTNATWRPLGALAQLHLEMGNSAEAYDCAKRAYELAPTRPNVLYALAFCSARANNVQESVAWARELVAGPLDEGFKKQGRRILFNIGKGTSNPELVIEACSASEPVEGIPPDQVVLFAAAAHGQLGNEPLRRETLTHGLSRMPDSFPIRLTLAETMERAGLLQEAATILGEGMEQPGAPAELYQRLGRVLAAQGKVQDATNAFTLWDRLRSAEAQPVS